MSYSSVIGVDLEAQNALDDSKSIIDERGLPISIYTNEETNVRRDIYSNIKGATKVAWVINAFPVIFNPTQDQIEKAGIKEKADAIITLAMLDFINAGKTYNDIDEIRWSIDILEDKYKISDIARINHFAGTYLNINIGLSKKE